MFIEFYPQISKEIVGREKELRVILATLEAGKHIVLEGPPGTTKSTLLRKITQASGIPFYIVEGNADLTPSKLVGHFNPSKVISDDYKPEYFEKGPLTLAMEGGFLYIEEFNRMPPDTANVLITAIEERELHIPRYSIVKADPRFRLICAQNPYDDIGTARVSRALYDRVCRIKLEYQNETEEKEIVKSVTGFYEEIYVTIAVKVARYTRHHPEVKQGVSVRGAIDTIMVLRELLRLGEVPYESLKSAALSAMSGKLLLLETCEKTPEAVLLDILDKVVRMVGASSEPHAHGEGPEGKDGGKESPEGTEPKEGEIEESESATQAGGKGEDPPLLETARKDSRKAGTLLNKNRELAEEVLQGMDALELFGHVRDKLNPELKALALHYASRLILKLAAQLTNMGLRTGELEVTKKQHLSDEIELDRTVEAYTVEPQMGMAANLRLWTREKRKRACMVMLDQSFSMRGAKVVMAALAAATISLYFQEDYGVVTFNTKPRLLKPLRSPRAAAKVAEEILSLEASGYTNIKEALEMAFYELKEFEKRIGVIITDGDWTCGGNPLGIAQLFDNLHVIGIEEYVPAHEEYIPFYTPWFSRKIELLAKEGKGKFYFVRNLWDVPKAITRCLRD